MCDILIGERRQWCCCDAWRKKDVGWVQRAALHFEPCRDGRSKDFMVLEVNGKVPERI
eukprot:SAG31_NODE_23193_length_509_cov_0.875610_1_plen_57_part_10